MKKKYEKKNIGKNNKEIEEAIENMKKEEAEERAREKELEKAEKVGGMTEMTEKMRKEAREKTKAQRTESALKRPKETSEYHKNLEPFSVKEEEEVVAIKMTENEIYLEKLKTEEQRAAKTREKWAELYVENKYSIEKTAEAIELSSAEPIKMTSRMLRSRLEKDKKLKNMFELANKERYHRNDAAALDIIEKNLQPGSNPLFAMKWIENRYSREELHELAHIPNHLIGVAELTQKEKEEVIKEIERDVRNVNALIYDDEVYPPDYQMVRRLRAMMEMKSAENKDYEVALKEYYKKNPVDFISHWAETIDPRNATSGTGGNGAKTPLVLFKKQRDLINWLLKLREHGDHNKSADGKRIDKNGIMRKSRDMGATWTICAFAVWVWLFQPASAFAFVSWKQELVDAKDIPDSILEKCRIIIRGLPNFLRPIKYNEDKHGLLMRILNPENAAYIRGSSGKQGIRGGRATYIACDEAAHYENPHEIDKALGDCTGVRIDVSSVNGVGNPFHLKWLGGTDYVEGKDFDDKISRFEMSWKDHPGKTQEWYDRRVKEAEDTGHPELTAQELDMSFEASKKGIIINTENVIKTIDLEVAGVDLEEGRVIVGFDIAGGGRDKTGFVIRKGAVVLDAMEFSQPKGSDQMRTIRLVVNRLNNFASEHNEIVDVMYDDIGIGGGIEGIIREMRENGDIDSRVTFYCWTASNKPLNGDDYMAGSDKTRIKDYYKNLKSQGWDYLKIKFIKGVRVVESGMTYGADELVTIPSFLSNKDKLIEELSQPVWIQDNNSKGIVDKAPEGTRSPNMADALMMAFHPVYPESGEVRAARSEIGN